MALIVESLDHLVINVNSVQITAEWYQRVLGMVREDSNPASGRPLRTSLHFGRQKINLRSVNASKSDWFTASHERAGSHDLCFLNRSRPEQVVEHLRSSGVAIELGPIEKHGAEGTLLSVYCRDPDGNLIEIASYAEQSS